MFRRPPILMSLLEMLQIYFGLLYHHVDLAKLVRRRLDILSLDTDNSEKAEIIADAQGVLKGLAKCVEDMELSDTHIDRMSIEDYDTLDRASFILERAADQVEAEAKKILCLVIHKDKSQVFKNALKECDELEGSFPNAAKEIESALFCYSVDQYTACVFHLMRAVEMGLRSLAAERGVEFPNMLVEWATWQDMIRAIEKNVENTFGNSPRGPKRDEILGFYRGALSEFSAFKDVYRNAVMHTRDTYDQHQARHAISHVLGFMKRLSRYLTEDQKTSIEWGSP